MSEVLTPFVEATVRTATPLAFAALGELVAERSGVINIGLEGTIIAGAFGGLVTAGAAGAAVGFLGAIAAVQAQDVITLKVHHFLGPTSIQHTTMLKTWCDNISKDSGNRLQCQIYPAMQLGGTPAQLYDQARDGVAEVRDAGVAGDLLTHIWDAINMVAGMGIPETAVTQAPEEVHE